MQAITYLFFPNGDCEQAFERYREVLGGTITARIRARGTPAEPYMPPDWADKLLHACLDLGETQLMGSDSPPACSEAPQGFAVQLTATSPEEAERLFTALGEGGTVRMPMAETFWARRFGQLVDRFGTPWMINCPLPLGEGAVACGVEPAM
jgi:PhnB protein